jgi:Protein of unknown function (DUF1064)
VARSKPSVRTAGARRARGLVKNEKMSALAKLGRRGKYNAKGERIDGIWFASQAEARRYEQLKEIQDAGLIEGLKCQPSFDITSHGVRICGYRADFRYHVLDERGRVEWTVIEDVKGMVTDVYDIKKKLLAAQGVHITEIPSKEISQWKGRTPVTSR